MAILSKGTTFQDGDAVTSTSLNNLVDNAAFVAGSSGTTDDATLQVLPDGRLSVKTVQTGNIAAGAITVTRLGDGAVTEAKLGSGAVTEAKLGNGAVATAKIADSAVTLAKLGLPSNFPIQVVQAVKTDIQIIDTDTTSWVDISDLSLTLTRAIASASGKVRIQANVSASSDAAAHGVALRIVRDSTAIDAATGDADGSRLRATSNGGYNGQYSNESIVVDYIDSSPGSSATVTYKIQARIYSTRIGYINRSFTDPNAGDYVLRTISTLTLTELSP